MLVRTITDRDDDRVAKLWHDAWHDGHAGLLPVTITAHRTPESFLARVRAQRAMMRAVEQDGRIVAFGAIDDAVIDQFYVARDSRGTGVAPALMAALVTEITGLGHRRIEVECALGNARAIRFYRRSGFRRTGVEERAVWMPDDAGPAAFPMVVLEKTF